MTGIFLWALYSSAIAALSADSWLQDARQDISRAGTAVKTFNRETDDPERLNVWFRQLSDVRVQAQKCIDAQAEVVERLKTLDAAGGSVETAASSDSNASTREIHTRISEQEAQLAQCRALLVDARTVTDQIRDLQAEILRTYLLSKGPNLLEVSFANLEQADSMYPLVKSFMLERLQLNKLRNSQWVVLTMLVATAVVLGVWWRRRIRQRLEYSRGAGITTAMMSSLQSCVAANLPLLFAASTAMAWFLYTLPTAPVPPSVVLLLGLLVFIAASVLVRMFLNPCPPAEHFLKVDPAYCRALGKRLHWLLALLLIAVLVYGLSLDAILGPEQWLIARAAFLSMVIMILLWLVMNMRKAPAPFNSRKLRGLIALVLMASLIAEGFGYRNLSVFLLRGLTGTALLASSLWVVNVLLQELFNGLDEGRYQWQQKLRNSLNLARDELFPGLIWLRLLSTLTIWSLFAALAFALWGYAGSVWTVLHEWLTVGFQVGGMQVVPLNWVIAIAIFALLVTAVRWVQTDALPGWVAKSGISHGAKEATITISGYVGMILAALIGLSLAGFNFTNLAIVVGALSVGIGFGLQNIVNNFISGIILLFERPIRTGDWIVVGNTEGYVRRISIRSTQIETFDRADVIVPNSELIASQVTNWMLNDPWGRVTVPIGVAYGTDVEQLREILLQVATNHPLVIKEGGKVSPPKVLFRGFGDSALDFEVRCFIRLVDRRLDTLSELNFAIERALREAGIQIPFPQRDLHVRSVDPSIDLTRQRPE
jgi:potassium efflux system protein